MTDWKRPKGDKEKNTDVKIIIILMITRNINKYQKHHYKGCGSSLERQKDRFFSYQI